MLKPIITVALFDGLPHAEITVDPAYKGRGIEQEMIREIFAAVKKWRDFDLDQGKAVQEKAE